jgi:hypothetical protein
LDTVRINFHIRLKNVLKGAAGSGYDSSFLSGRFATQAKSLWIRLELAIYIKRSYAVCVTTVFALVSRVADPHHFNADLHHFNADPVPARHQVICDHWSIDPCLICKRQRFLASESF